MKHRQHKMSANFLEFQTKCLHRRPISISIESQLKFASSETDHSFGTPAKFSEKLTFLNP